MVQEARRGYGKNATARSVQRTIAKAPPKQYEHKCPPTVFEVSQRVDVRTSGCRSSVHKHVFSNCEQVTEKMCACVRKVRRDRKLRNHRDRREDSSRGRPADVRRIRSACTAVDSPASSGQGQRLCNVPSY